MKIEPVKSLVIDDIAWAMKVVEKLEKEHYKENRRRGRKKLHDRGPAAVNPPRVEDVLEHLCRLRQLTVAIQANQQSELRTAKTMAVCDKVVQVLYPKRPQ